jgi:hypothetical protein
MRTRRRARKDLIELKLEEGEVEDEGAGKGRGRVRDVVSPARCTAFRRLRGPRRNFCVKLRSRWARPAKPLLWVAVSAIQNGICRLQTLFLPPAPSLRGRKILHAEG